MMKLINPQFSIILPVRNGGDYVKECINSILQQDHKDFNLLVLENCSTDGTYEWLKTLKDERIQLYPSDHLLSMDENWSRLTNIPKNEFITIIGHDDLLYRNYLSVMKDLILKHPTATLYQAHYTYVNAQGIVTRKCLPRCEVQFGHEFLAMQLMRTLDCVATGFMFRSKDFDAVGGLPKYYNLIFADYELWIKLACKGYIATSLSECLSYREHESASALTQVEEYLKGLEQYLFFIERQSKMNENIKVALQRYAADYLCYMCEGLICRALKGKGNKKRLTVTHIVKIFKKIANHMLPNEQVDLLRSPYLKIILLFNRFKIGNISLNIVDSIKPKIKYILSMLAN